MENKMKTIIPSEKNDLILQEPESGGKLLTKPLIILLLLGAIAALFGAGIMLGLEISSGEATEELISTEVTVSTSSPTISPTVAPSKMLTESPTSSPNTLLPTTSPTASPIQSPTLSPTKNPTSSPSFNPTKNPSSSPTIIPTASPSQEPTTNPTISPTVNPTENPTETPTIFPTEQPTISPTMNPTEFSFCLEAGISDEEARELIRDNVTPTDTALLGFGTPCLPSDAFRLLSGSQKSYLGFKTLIRFSGEIGLFHQDAFVFEEFLRIETIIFENMDNLKSLPDGLFRSFPILDNLSIIRCPQLKLDNDIFGRFFGNIIDPPLKSLILNHNNFDAFPNVLQFKSNVEILALAGNNLNSSALDTNVFQDLTIEFTLFLSENPLATLEPGFIGEKLGFNDTRIDLDSIFV